MESPKQGRIRTILKRLKTVVTSLTQRIFKRSVFLAIQERQLKSKEIVIVTSATVDTRSGTWKVSDNISIMYAGEHIRNLPEQQRASVLKGAPVVMATNCLMDCIVDFEDVANQRIYDAVIKEMGEIYLQCSPELNKDP